MGKRYTKQEISQIQALTTEGHTIIEIAETLGRPEAGIRNIRHRKKLKVDTKESIKKLGKDKAELSRNVNRLRWELQSLQSRKEKLSTVLQTDETTLNARLQTALRKLRDVRPELFHITMKEQLEKLAIEIAGSYIRYLIE